MNAVGSLRLVAQQLQVYKIKGIHKLVAEGDLRSSNLQFVPGGAVGRGLISAWQSFYTQYVVVTISRNTDGFRNNSYDNGIELHGVSITSYDLGLFLG